MNAGTFAILGYVVLQLGIGYVASRGIRTEKDYLLAGRRLGPWLVFFSVFATWFGAETCIGSSGEAFESGLWAVRADPFGYTICLLLMAAFLAVPLWKRGITTLSDLFRERFGPRAEKLSVLVMVPSSVMWAGAQIRAFGQVLTATSGSTTESTVFWMTTLAAAVVILYTSVGGMMADAVSDLVQGCILVSGLIALLVMMFASGDLARIAEVDAAHLALAAPGEGVLQIVESWSVPIFGSLFAQELISRVVSARGYEVARSSTFAAAPLYFTMGFIPVLVGLVGSVLMPELEHPEQVLSHTAARYFSPVMMVLFQGAIVAAILSTVDSALLVAGSLFGHNLVLPLFPSITERQKVRIDRVAVACFGVVAYGLALGSESVYSLVEAASAFGSAGVLVCGVFGMFTRVGGEQSAVGALIAGVALYAGGEHLLELPYPFLTSIAGATLVYAIAARVWRSDAEHELSSAA